MARRGLLGAAVLATGCVAYGTVVERRWYALRRAAIGGVLAPGADRSLRILLVGDLHLVPPDEPLRRYVAGLADLDYDLAVAAGDLLGGRGAEDAAVEVLAPLVDGRPGVAVLGSNDHHAPAMKSPLVYFLDPERRVFGDRLDTDRLRRGLADRGWVVLEDDRRTVPTAAGEVELAGLTDPHMSGRSLPPREDLATRDPQAVARIGLVHAPYQAALDLLTLAGYDLILAAHTHGGQVRMPLVGALTVNCDLPLSLARGTARWWSPAGTRSAWLHITAGLGQSKYAPFRFLCRPEASLLELVPSPAPASGM